MWPFPKILLEEKSLKLDQSHRVLERKQWKNQNRTANFNNLLTLLGVGVASGAAWGAWNAAFWAEKTYVEAKAQAEASWNSAQSARRQADAATRSYLFITARDGTSISRWILGTSSIDIPIHLDDYGSSPAIIEQAGCLAIKGNEDSPPDGSFNKIFFLHQLETGNLILKDIKNEVVSLQKPLDAICRADDPINDQAGFRGFNENRQTKDFWKAHRALNGVVWIIISVRYSDVSGNMHGTNFCAKDNRIGGLIMGGTGECQKRN